MGPGSDLDLTVEFALGARTGVIRFESLIEDGYDEGG
jgi:hypothetical protein